MERKPTVAAGYTPAAAQVVRAASLYLATKLGDLRDELVIVGGLVPSLLVPQTDSPTGRPLHVGTMDVDLGLAIAILDEQRYRELCERLRDAGLQPDQNEAGRPTNQRWRIESDSHPVTVDFLIPATREGDRGGALRNLEAGFAAIITPGLELAFEDRRLIALSGETLHHEQATREVWVCEAGAFTVLKALAFEGRGENKDAYDLLYVLQNYGEGIGAVFLRLKPLLQNPTAEHALHVLERDFAGVDSVGTKRFAEFLGERRMKRFERMRPGLCGLCCCVAERAGSVCQWRRSDSPILATPHSGIAYCVSKRPATWSPRYPTGAALAHDDGGGDDGAGAVCLVGSQLTDQRLHISMNSRHPFDPCHSKKKKRQRSLRIKRLGRVSAVAIIKSSF